ncbi:MAG: ABC transporter ATP-binding protein [Alkaliphilus sp.]
MNAVSIENLNVIISKKTILKNISFSVCEGEIVGLIGPSGAGKTTIVKTITGIVKKSKGLVEIMGFQRITNELLMKLGYMAQKDALYDDLNAHDHLKFFGRLYSVKPKELEDRIVNILKLVDLQDEANKLVYQYSGGMKRRLSLAIALINNPVLLVLDEPTVGLDPILRRKFWKEFKEMKKKGKSLIITTHTMDEAAACDRLVFIYRGEILAFDTPAKLLKASNTATVEEAFIHYITSERGAES